VLNDAVIGWDLGGAHLKVARVDASGAVERVLQLPCPLWQGMQHLDAALEQALPALGSAPVHAVTMTGEMVDLFPDRAEGVVRLLAALRGRLPQAALRIYAGADGFLNPEGAPAAAARIASANWQASATLVAAQTPAALVIDIGSTTTDLVVVRAGRVCARGRDDAGRLVAGELLYTGVVRTPLMAVAERVPFAGDWVPVMAEHFATTADVHRLTGQLPPDADQHAPADGGAKTASGSARRLARMIGRDSDSAPLAAWRRLAGWLAQAQLRQVEDACDRLLSREDLDDDAPIVPAGVGRFLVAELARRRGRSTVEFASLLPAGNADPALVSDCAPAVAVAWLAQRA
jgi:(4-(4-[2-(gamma-L-glutamylamino)ethyl]phenoxymethyl)furan-2-yl)methanamine synthase